MKKLVPHPPLSHRPLARLHGLFFWLALGAVLALAFLVLARLAPRPAHLAPPRGPHSPQLRWLLTGDGERRGFALRSNLALDGAAWELWGNGAGQPPLAPLDRLYPESRPNPPSLGCNGGYWDETEHAVGVCAGQRGIHGARSHPQGFAIAGDRAWIGPLSAHIQLALMAGDRPTSPALELPLNPRPPPRHAPCLIDPQAYPWPLRLDSPTEVIWLDRATTAPLRFNTTVPLRVRQALPRQLGLVTPPPAGCLLWLSPQLKSAPPAPLAPRPGDCYELSLTLDPVRGVVQLATCAGPRLLKDGKIRPQLYEHTGGDDERTWRTVVGCDRDGRTLWLVVLARGLDGQPGVTLGEAAQTLLEQGASEGLNLDGGSSTSVCSSQLGPELLSLFPLRSEIHHALFLIKKLEL